MVSSLLLVTTLFFSTGRLQDNWFQYNILGFELGYHKFKISVLEIAYGSLSKGYGIGAGLFEYNAPLFEFLPVILYLVKPLGNNGGPVSGKFGGPVLFSVGYQYPAVAYIFTRSSILTINQGTRGAIFGNGLRYWEN